MHGTDWTHHPSARHSSPPCGWLNREDFFFARCTKQNPRVFGDSTISMVFLEKSKLTRSRKGKRPLEIFHFCIEPMVLGGRVRGGVEFEYEELSQIA